MVCDTDRLTKLTAIPAQKWASGNAPVTCRAIVSRLAGRTQGLGMNRAFRVCVRTQFCIYEGTVPKGRLNLAQDEVLGYARKDCAVP